MIAVAVATLSSLITVGPKGQFARLEQALEAAHPGDRIVVAPAENAYARTAVRIRVSHVTIEGGGASPVTLSGVGFDYSGAGSVPRAIIEVEPGADGVTIRNLQLRGAHNRSHNGAGIRINGANHVTVERCDIAQNDMGVMSNGTDIPHAVAEDQRFLDCHIHNNGDVADPGYNHNLYLGGMSATLRHCEVAHSTTGHNVKSRAHFTLLQDCFVHDAANRECDFVEARETERHDSNAALVNCVVVKRPDCPGNRVVIHFGREKGIRRGGLWLIQDTIITPFASAVIQMDGDHVHADLEGNVILNSRQANPILAACSDGANVGFVTGRSNWLSKGYKLSDTAIDSKTRYAGTNIGETLGLTAPPFRAKGLPDIGVPNPAYYRDGAGRQWEVTPTETLGATWRPLTYLVAGE